MLSFLARWQASWTDRLHSGLQWEYLPGYTVEALMEDIRYHRLRLDGDWTPRDDLSVRLTAGYWDYSDGNSRVDATAQLGYELPWVEGLTGLYRLTLADTREESAAYYTPRQLVQNQIGVEYRWRPSQRVTGRIRYLLGYGDERDQPGRIVHAAHVDLLFRNVGGLNLRPSIDFQQTPTYQMFRAALTADWKF